VARELESAGAPLGRQRADQATLFVDVAGPSSRENGLVLLETRGQTVRDACRDCQWNSYEGGRSVPDRRRQRKS
jgi:hypothetical protein